MLVLGRRVNESIVLQNNDTDVIARIKVNNIASSRITLGVTARNNVFILRTETLPELRATYGTEDIAAMMSKDRRKPLTDFGLNCVSRKLGESITLITADPGQHGLKITITYVSGTTGSVRLCFDAPRNISIVRNELIGS